MLCEQPSPYKSWTALHRSRKEGSFGIRVQYCIWKGSNNVYSKPIHSQNKVPLVERAMITGTLGLDIGQANKICSILGLQKRLADIDGCQQMWLERRSVCRSRSFRPLAFWVPTHRSWHELDASFGRCVSLSSVLSSILRNFAVLHPKFRVEFRQIAICIPTTDQWEAWF